MMGVNRSLVVWLASFFVVVWAQNSNVEQCISSYDWAINSKGQTPCLVAAYLRSGCGRPERVDGIPTRTHYIGPTVAEADGCHCSSVTYSLMSACAGCQDRSYLNWTTWSYNCSEKYESSFPGNISTATSVPLWAYLDLSETGDTFDPVAAARNASVILSSSIFPTRSLIGSTTTVSFLLSGFPTPSQISSSSNSAPNIGAIVGGVLGGVVGLAILLLVLLLWYLKRRSNRTRKDGVVFDKAALVSGPSTTSGTSSPFNHANSPTYMQSTTGSPLFISSPSLPGSPMSTTRRSLEGPSASIRYFGSTLQANRYPGPGFRTESDHGHPQI